MAYEIASQSFRDNLERRKLGESRTLLERLGTGIFDVLNSPSNILRSLIIGDPINALKVITPGVESRRVTSQETANALGFELPDNFFAELAFDIVTDPLTYVGGIGTLTKAGKATKLAAEATGKLEVLSKARSVAQKLEDTGAAAKQIPGTAFFDGLIEQENKVLKGNVTKGGVPERALVTLNVPFTKGTLEVGKRPEVFEALKLLYNKTVDMIPDNIRHAFKKGFKTTADFPSTQVLKELSKTRYRAAVEIVDKESVESALAVKRIIDIDNTLGNADVVNKIELRHIIGRNENPHLRQMVTQRDKEKLAIQQTLLEPFQGKEIPKDVMDNFTKEMADVDNAFAKKFESIKFSKDKGAITVKNIHTEEVNAHTAELTASLKSLAIKKNVPVSQLKGGKEYDAIIDKYVGKMEKSNRELADRTYLLKDRVVATQKMHGPVDDLIVNFLDVTGGDLDDMVKRAELMGVKITPLGSSKGMTKYFPRFKSDEAWALRKTDPQKWAGIQSEVNTTWSNTKRRSLYPELTVPEMNAKLREDFGINFDFYKTDIADVLHQYKLKYVRTMNSADYMHTAINTFGTTEKLAKGEGVTAKALFKKVGLNPDVAPSLNIPKKFAKDILSQHDQVRKMMRNPEEFVTGALRLVEKVNALYRPMLTDFFPAYSNRNMVTNTIQSAVVNGISPIKDAEHYIRGFQILGDSLKGTISAEDQAILSKASAWLGFKNTQFDEYLKSSAKGFWGEARKLSERPISYVGDKLKHLVGIKSKYDPLANGIDGVFIKGTKIPLSGVGKSYGRYVENGHKLSSWLALKARGMSDIDAMRATNKALFDYSDISMFENKYLRPVFLFYTWSRKNIPLMLNVAATNPRPMEIYRQITALDKDEVPDYLRGGFAFPAPEFLGKDLYIGSLGVPFEDLNLLNVGDEVPIWSEQLKRMGQRIASRTSPLIQLPLAALTGEQAFTGKKLSELGPLEALGFTPASRIVSATKKAFFEPGRSIPARLVDALTGIRTYRAYPEQAALDTFTRSLVKEGIYTPKQSVELSKEYSVSDELRKELGFDAGEQVPSDVLSSAAAQGNDQAKRALEGREVNKMRQELIDAIREKKGYKRH